MRSIFTRVALPILLVLAGIMTSSVAQAQDFEADARQLVADYESRLRPLEITAALAWWDANTTGSDAAFAKKQEAETALDKALSDTARFAKLKACDEAKLEDATLAREVRLMYLGALSKQVDPAILERMTALSNTIDMKFNKYRAKVGGEELADSAVRKALKESKDTAERQAVWEASKGVGAEVAPDLATLVDLRNQAAKKLGFANFQVMQLYLNEQDPEALLQLFDELDALTKGPYTAAKAEIDAKLAANCGVKIEELLPWHYQDPFFQEAPAIEDTNLDAVYANVKIMDVCERFYEGVGLPIKDVLARSSLYEEPGKSPHAFCTDINREGDVRVLANVVPNEYWMGTMLHELGHAVYSSKNIPASVPYVVRTDAHILCTEGVAMQFERFSKSAEWLTEMGVKVDDPDAFNAAGARMRRNKLLIFSRWCQVMFRFEKGMYEDPQQDLNKLWWDLVEKYQLVKRPEGRNAPDFASKIHVVSAPCYYHNYMMGELFACQVHRALCAKLYPGKDSDKVTYVGDQRVGQFMKERVFAPGRLLPWNELTRHATGQELSAESFAADFAGE
ncbi:MAG: M2 family metallopeptidase [Planctomycetia bacterium]|nr:M2 family metallopeptidase [Planctomycetia bacterium]